MELSGILTVQALCVSSWKDCMLSINLSKLDKRVNDYNQCNINNSVVMHKPGAFNFTMSKKISVEK